MLALTEVLGRLGVPLIALTEVLAKTEAPLLAALAWPKANSKELRAILDYMTISIMLEELTSVAGRCCYLDSVLTACYSDNCSSEVAKMNCKLWIDVLKDPQAGKGHRHPFIQLMTK